MLAALWFLLALHTPTQPLLPPPRHRVLTKNDTATAPRRPADTASKQLAVPYEHEWWWWA
jgi:hypothetical protein